MTDKIMLTCDKCGKILEPSEKHSNSDCYYHNILHRTKIIENLFLLTPEELGKLASWVFYEGAGLNQFWARKVMQHIAKQDAEVNSFSTYAQQGTTFRESQLLDKMNKLETDNEILSRALRNQINMDVFSKCPGKEVNCDLCENCSYFKHDINALIASALEEAKEDLEYEKP